MLVQEKSKVAICGWIIVATLTSCGGDCNTAVELNVLPRNGQVHVDTIYMKWGDHAYTAFDRADKQKLLFNDEDFVVAPQVGDSMVKRKGEAEYTLYRGDSVYVQRFDCEKKKGIIVSQYKLSDSLVK